MSTPERPVSASLVAAVVLVTVLGTVAPMVGATLATDGAADCQGRTTVPEELDVGNAYVGNTTTATYTFENPTNQTISFSSSIEGADADVFGIASGGGGSVGPGACARITLSFSPDEPGDYDASLVVEVSGSTGGTALDGTGLAPKFPQAAFGPESHDFGSVNVGSSATTEFVLRNAGDAPLAVTSVDISGSDAFSIKDSLPDVIGPGQTAAVTVAFSPSETGEASATISVGTNDSGASGLSGTVTGEGIETSLSLSSASMSFGDVPVGESETTSVTVTNDGTEPVSVSEVSVEGPGADAFTVVESPGSIDPGSSATLTVRFQPSEATSYAATIAMETASESAPGLGVSLGGAGTAPEITVAPASINFGKTVTSDVLTRSVRIINRGSQPLRVTSLSIVGSDPGAFSVVDASLPMTIAPGGSAGVTVKFSPTAARPHSASLVVGSNASSGSATVYLSNTKTTVEQTSRSTGDATQSTIDVNDASEGQTLTFAFSSSESGSRLLYAGAASEFRMPEKNVSLSLMNLTVAKGGDFQLGVAASQDALNATPRFTLETRNGTEPVGYLNVTHTIPDESIEEVEFTHRVSKQKLDALNASPEDYALYRYHDGEWVELDVTVVGETAGYYEFRATSPGLSDFTSGVKQPKFRVVDTEVEVTKINIGEDVGVRVKIRNDGGADGTYTTRLILDGEVVAQKDATIGPKGKRVVTFEQEISQSGTYTVQVNNVTIDDVQVTAKELSNGSASPDAGTTEPGATNTGVPGFGVVVALVALLATALLARREH